MTEPTIVIPESLKKSKEFGPPVAEVSDWMRDYFRESPEPITATWGTVRGRSSRVYVSLELTLPGLPKQAVRVFTADEIAQHRATQSDAMSALSELLGYRGRQILDGISEAEPQDRRGRVTMPSRTNTDRINDFDGWSKVAEHHIAVHDDKIWRIEDTIDVVRAEHQRLIHDLATRIAVLETDLAHLRLSHSLWGGRAFALGLAALTAALGAAVGFFAKR